MVDIARIPELAFVRDLGQAVAIGAATTQRTAERDPLVRAKLPLLAHALPFVGHAATRARGTIGGGRGPRLTEVDGPVDLAFQPSIDTWNGRTRVSLKIRDFRAAEAAVLSRTGS